MVQIRVRLSNSSLKVRFEMRVIFQQRMRRELRRFVPSEADSSVTWLVVACVSTSCFLAVFSVFLYVLLIKTKLKKKTKKNADYFLARQDSAF